jgi:hypothetical protein
MESKSFEVDIEFFEEIDLARKFLVGSLALKMDKRTRITLDVVQETTNLGRQGIDPIDQRMITGALHADKPDLAPIDYSAKTMPKKKNV